MLRRRLMKKGIPVFSVSDTKQVYFSNGNLQLPAASTWEFAGKQWSCFGNSQSDNHRDLFGWGTGNNPNQSSNSTSSYRTFNDWGTAAASSIGEGWRTLTNDEWVYLLNARTVNGGTGSGKSYTLGQSVEGKLGVVIYPDSYTGAEYSGSNWSTFEAKGCIFLPAAGSASPNSRVYNVGSYGNYWSATPHYMDGYAYAMTFSSSSINPRGQGTVSSKYSVRLVYDIT